MVGCGRKKLLQLWLNPSPRKIPLLGMGQVNTIKRLKLQIVICLKMLLSATRHGTLQIWGSSALMEVLYK